MKNALMPLTAMVGLILGLTVWPVNASEFKSRGLISQSLQH
jgi:hypothetical protein